MVETGTVYAVKVGVGVTTAVIGALADLSRVDYFVDCIPEAGASLPNLSVDAERETLNGFYVGSQHFQGATASSAITRDPTLNEKFKFRRKCDRNSFVRLLARVVTLNGTGNTAHISGEFDIIIRMR